MSATCASQRSRSAVGSGAACGAGDEKPSPSSGRHKKPRKQSSEKRASTDEAQVEKKKNKKERSTKERARGEKKYGHGEDDRKEKKHREKKEKDGDAETERKKKDKKHKKHDTRDDVDDAATIESEKKKKEKKSKEDKHKARNEEPETVDAPAAAAAAAAAPVTGLQDVMKAHRDAHLEELRKKVRERYMRILVETGSSCTMQVDEVLEYPDAFDWELLYPGTGLANFRIWCRLCGKEVSDGAKHGHLASKGHLEKWEQYIRCGSAGMPLKPMPPKAEVDSSALVSRGGTGSGVGRDGSNGARASLSSAGPGRPLLRDHAVNGGGARGPLRFPVADGNPVPAAAPQKANDRAAALVAPSSSSSSTSTLSSDLTRLQRVAMEETAGYPDPNGLEEGLNEAEIKIIAETKGIIECPPVDMMRDPQVFRTSYVNRQGAAYFETRCRLCPGNKVCWQPMQDGELDGHVASAPHQRRFRLILDNRHTAASYQKVEEELFRQEAAERQERDAEERDRQLAEKMARLGYGVPGSTASVAGSVGRMAGRSGGGAFAGSSSSSTQTLGLPNNKYSNRSTSERLDEKWSLDAAIAENGPARFLDDVVNEDIATDLDRVNMFSAYNQLPFERLGSYLQKLSAVLGQDMDVEHYSSGVSAYAGPKEGPEEKSCIFTGARMFDEGKGLLSSGKSVYSDAKTHKIAKSAVGASSAAGHSLAGSSAGVPSLFDGGDRESIYSRASTSGNTFLNLKKKPSKVWNDHRCVNYLAKQTGAVSGQSFHFQQPRRCVGGVQVPYEWCIFVPVGNDRAAGSGLRMFCTLCEKGVNDPTQDGVNHTTDGPNEHQKNLAAFQADQYYRDRSRKRRWKLIREHSPMYWDPEWEVDELALRRAKGRLAVYCSLYHLEQFAVRTALTRGQEILKDHIKSRKFTQGQVERQMAKYTEQEEEHLFAIYYSIAFEAGKWEQYITPSDRMSDEDEDEEMLEREALNVDDFRQNSAAEEANPERGGA